MLEHQLRIHWLTRRIAKIIMNMILGEEGSVINYYIILVYKSKKYNILYNCLCQKEINKKKQKHHIYIDVIDYSTSRCFCSYLIIQRLKRK